MVTRTARPVADDEHSVEGVGRFELRTLLGLLGLLAGALPFLALLLLVVREWEPLQALDQAVADELNRLVSPSPLLVDALQRLTDLGGNLAVVYVFVLTTVWLCIRSQRRLAAFVATTGLGLAVLVPVTKLLVGRPRPDVALPVAEIPSTASFPSGHAMISVVAWTTVALVLMPSVRRRARPWLLVAALAVAVVVGATRLALGVHFVSDVVAGWALGAGWLAVTTAAFRAWQRDEHVEPSPLSDGLGTQADHDHDRALAPGPAPALPRGRATAVRLAAGAAAIVVVLSGLGLLVTGPLADTALGRVDGQLVGWALELRAELRTDGAKAVSELSGTRAVIMVSLAVAVLSVATTGRRRPGVFVVAVVTGELLLYVVVSYLVGQARPDVLDLTTGLPIRASWPSGHAAAAVAIYGSLAVLVWLHTRSRWRWVALGVAVVVPPLVGATRVYVAAHHPTDVVAGLLLGWAWLLLCTRLLLLDDGARPGRHGSAPVEARHAA